MTKSIYHSIEVVAQAMKNPRIINLATERECYMVDCQNRTGLAFEDRGAKQDEYGYYPLHALCETHGQQAVEIINAARAARN